MRARYSWTTFAIVTALGALAVALFWLKQDNAAMGAFALVGMVLAGAKMPVVDALGRAPSVPPELDDVARGEP